MNMPAANAAAINPIPIKRDAVHQPVGASPPPDAPPSSCGTASRAASALRTAATRRSVGENDSRATCSNFFASGESSVMASFSDAR
jgi:hypothetical protein